MRITHLTSVHLRYDTRIFYKHSLSLFQHHHKVNILVNDKNKNEIVDGINIISTGKTFSNKSKRILNSLFIFPFKAVFIPSDVYIIHDPELIPTGYLLLFLFKKVIFDIHEDYIQVQFKNKGLLKSIIGQCYNLLANIFVRWCYATIVVNERLYRHYQSKAKKIFLIPNFPHIPVSEPSLELRDSAKLKIVFAGGITEDWNISLVAKTISDLKEVEFHLIGKSNPYLDSIDISAIDNVVYYGLIPHTEVHDLLLNMDVGVAISSSSQGQDEGTIGNTKVFEYMAAGLPVIVNKNDTWNNIVKLNNVGFVLNHINEEELAYTIKTIARNPDLLRQMKQSSLDLIHTKYNWDLSYAPLIDFFDISKK